MDSIKHLERFNGVISIYVEVEGYWLEREFWSGEIEGENFKIEADLDFDRNELVNLDLTGIKDKKEIGCTVGHLENKQSIKMVSKLTRRILFIKKVSRFKKLMERQKLSWDIYR